MTSRWQANRNVLSYAYWVAIAFVVVSLDASLWACPQSNGSPPPSAETFHWTKPGWAPTPLVPKDNPMSDAKVRLGRALFY
ncbi:MAG TPA: di-heme enzyme, partial [Candidatus Eisenbacteria bacterium]|nr:di-heme enzyme [Candidatus Eisenbacteria bacterium]